MKKTVFFGLLAIMLVYNFISCDNSTGGNGTDDFVQVTDITGLPTELALGSTLTLSGTVIPNNATNNNITWSIKYAGNTGASLNGNVLSVVNGGWVELTATIDGGLANGNAYTKDFGIDLLNHNVSTNTLNFCFWGDFEDHLDYDDKWQEWLSGGLLLQDFYDGSLIHGKTYKITVNGNLDTQLPYLKIEIEGFTNDEEHWFGAGFSPNGPFLPGPIEAIFEVSIDDPDGFAQLNNAIIHFELKTNWTKDTTMSATDLGRIMAKINNFSVTIEEL